jgi:ribosomal-protein-alanine N-acetyltransferase
VNADVVTDQLILRPFLEAEARAVQAGVRQPHWADGYPTDGDFEVAALLLAAPLADHGPHLWQVIVRDTGVVIGGIGFFSRDEGSLAVGYGIAPEFHSRGLTTEAVLALVEVARRTSGIDRLVADTTVDNLPSQRVLEKAGFTLDRVDGAQVFYRLALR